MTAPEELQGHGDETRAEKNNQREKCLVGQVILIVGDGRGAISERRTGRETIEARILRCRRYREVVRRVFDLVDEQRRIQTRGHVAQTGQWVIVGVFRSDGIRPEDLRQSVER